MCIKNVIFPLVVTTAFLAACSDNAAPTVVDDGIASTEEVTTYTCNDGSVANSAAECESGVSDSTTTTVYVCVDGTQTTNASDCAATVSGKSSASGKSATSENDDSTYDPTSSQEVIEQVVADAVVYKEAEGDLKLTFGESGLSVQNDENSCVSVNGTVATISCAGNYYLSGKSSNFQVVVAASSEALVYLYLNGLDLTSGNDAPFYVQSAEKVFFMLVDGTENNLVDASTRTIKWKYTKNGVAKIDTTMGTIYAKDDITFKGNGKLTVTGNYNNGVHTTNDLRIKDVPSITVTAKNNALKGKGSVNIEGGYYTLTASEGDGIKSDEGEEEGSVTDNTKGKIVITGGEFSIKAKDDGIQAYNYVLLADSVATPKITVNSSNGKGIVSDNLIYINAGIVNVTSADDGIHSNMNVYFNGGVTTISAGDDGVHADSTLMINNGIVNVIKAVEGFEGWYIIAKGGKTAVVTSDDGWNAAGGSADANSTSGSQWGGPGGGGAASKSVGYIEIYGGYHYLYAAGNDVDVLDANGTVKMSGGVVILELGSGGMGGGMSSNRPGSQGGSTSGSCSTNMSGGIIDTDSGISVTGGVLLGFGSQTESMVNCNSVSFTAGTAYGSNKAAFKPSVSGSMIVFSNDVGSSVSSVDVGSMSTVELANGMTYYYK
ncbi:MAG: carbohydrate-binding domain-containing protein [Fibrobacter sp.]|nr:carbohydrate-binding domain-containing protein [Fibrobacter sp.]